MSIHFPPRNGGCLNFKPSIITLNLLPYIMNPNCPPRRHGRLAEFPRTHRMRVSASAPFTILGGVNHCRSHCLLAKLRGLMYEGKCSDVTGRKTRFFVCAQYRFPGYRFSSANHSAVFPPIHQTTECRQTTVCQTTV